MRLLLRVVAHEASGDHRLTYAAVVLDAMYSGRLERLLDAAEASSPVEALETVTRELGRAFGATEVSFLIADLSGRALVRLTHVPLADSVPARAPAVREHEDGQGGHEGADGPGAVAAVEGVGPDDLRARRNGSPERSDARERATVLPFDGGPAEQAVLTQNVQVVAPATAPLHGQRADPAVVEPCVAGPATAGAGAWTVLAPITERGEVIGVLEMLLPQEPSADTKERIAQMAHFLAFVVIANRRHTDLFEWGQRSRPSSLSAEIQQRLLPASRTCEAGAFTLSAWLEPASDIAGDTFDYSLARDHLHLSVTDAMGHGVAAALTATLCVSGLRGARRRSASLLEQAASTNASLVAHAIDKTLDDYVTGVIGRLDLNTGVLELVNAGHVPPYLARGDQVRSLDLPADLPFGLFPETTYRATSLELEPGDRLVFVTDGMLERSAAGLDLAEVIGRTRDLHPREAARRLADSILAETGQDLRDDATILLVDWHGEHGRLRTTTAGADWHRAGARRS